MTRPLVLALSLLAWACTGDRAVISPTFEVCPELGYDGGGNLRALGVWWPAPDPDAVAFDVAVDTCGQGRLPSAALLAQVPAEAWTQVLNTPVLSAQVLLYADVDGSGDYTPRVDPYHGYGVNTPLSYVPAAVQGVWP